MKVRDTLPRNNPEPGTQFQGQVITDLLKSSTDPSIKSSTHIIMNYESLGGKKRIYEFITTNKREERKTSSQQNAE